jgi:hypothetical protein
MPAWSLDACCKTASVVGYAALHRVRSGARADENPIVCLPSDSRHWGSCPKRWDTTTLGLKISGNFRWVSSRKI